MAFSNLDHSDLGDIPKDIKISLILPNLNVGTNPIVTKPIIYNSKILKKAYISALKKSVDKLDDIEFDPKDYDCQRALDLDIYATELKTNGFKFSGADMYNTLTVKLAVIDTCKAVPSLKKILDMKTKTHSQLLNYTQGDEIAMRIYESNLSNQKGLDIEPFLKNMPKL
ncbi:hypothetical protein HN924_02250 [Candidatus Woesearchaeota archaeon]|jgi:hypothetical protein|nr:hypothetical protein [Candidatus Woesearchaeota archaeon]MBT7062766.1 hypothetical protein [Candidatus Woesearchaeota archaeon]